MEASVPGTPAEVWGVMGERAGESYRGSGGLLDLLKEAGISKADIKQLSLNLHEIHH